jgi:hypothetical protein
MDKETILTYFNTFKDQYQVEKKDEIWMGHRKVFQIFWKNRMMNKSIKDLYDQEIDEIIRILDRHGKGNVKDSEAVAKAMIPQGAWRRMFNDIHSDNKLQSLLNDLFVVSDSDKSNKINEIYKTNLGHKNNLTGQSGTAISAFLAANNPFEYLSIVSLNDRIQLMNYFKIPWDPETLTIGERIIKSNILILQYFKSLGLQENARTISCFAYDKSFKLLWKNVIDQVNDSEEGDINLPEHEQTNDYLFYMESQLEDFLIENWDKSPLGKKYSLLEENGDLVSQQYNTDIGKIDILAKEKETDSYVVIELKKNQTSDDTVGQLARYMGWVEEHLSKGVPPHGIIIAAKYDSRLSYAIKVIPNIEVFLYRVDFKLEGFHK